MSGPPPDDGPADEPDDGPDEEPDAWSEVRPATDADSAAVIALIESCFSEYDGCVLDTETEMIHLLRVASHFAAVKGCSWVAEVDGSVVGSVACRPAGDPSGLELQMLYVLAPWRNRGLGSRLVALVESEAAGRGSTFVELWSDTRFIEAHRLYHSLGYIQLPGIRELRDLSASREYQFTKFFST
jgi:putative acetyltransferase